MSNRMKALGGLLLFQALTSYFFAVVIFWFAGGDKRLLLSGLIALLAAQFVVGYVMLLIRRTEPSVNNWYIDYCKQCVQMTNHSPVTQCCLKCGSCDVG